MSKLAQLREQRNTLAKSANELNNKVPGRPAHAGR
jgi:hypothetical protein